MWGRGLPGSFLLRQLPPLLPSPRNPDFTWTGGALRVGGRPCSPGKRHEPEAGVASAGGRGKGTQVIRRGRRQLRGWIISIKWIILIRSAIGSGRAYVVLRAARRLIYALGATHAMSVSHHVSRFPTA